MLNYLFRNTPLVGWKQMLIYLLMVLAFLRCAGFRSLAATVFGLICPAVLIAASVAQGQAPAKVAQDILYYVGWVPFYLFARSRGVVKDYRLANFSVVFIAVSAIGLIVQLYTPYLNFLNDNLASLQYQALNSEARRLPLYFVASTIVMPTLIGFYCLICMEPAPGPWRVLVPLPFLVAAAIPTGSLSAIECLAGAVLMALAAQRGGSARLLIGGVLIGLVALVVVNAFAEHATGLAKLQLDRILNNNQYSESNRGRLLLWAEAMRLISGFNPVQHLVGNGVGATHASRLGEQTIIHGESSFFQAYLEGGLLGFMLRMAPFALLLTPGGRRLNRMAVLIYGATAFVACAVAPIFGAFGVECTLGFVAGLVNRGLGKDNEIYGR